MIALLACVTAIDHASNCQRRRANKLNESIKSQDWPSRIRIMAPPQSSPLPRIFAQSKWFIPPPPPFPCLYRNCALRKYSSTTTFALAFHCICSSASLLGVVYMGEKWHLTWFMVNLICITAERSAVTPFLRRGRLLCDHQDFVYFSSRHYS